MRSELDVIGMLSNKDLMQREAERLEKRGLKTVRVRNKISMALRIQLMKNYGYDVVYTGKKMAC